MNWKKKIRSKAEFQSLAFLDFTGPMSLAQLPSDRHKGLVNSSLPSSVINTTEKEEQENRRRRRRSLVELEGNCSTEGRDGRGFACRHPQKLPRGEGDAGALWAVWEEREKESINSRDKVINTELRGKGLSK